MAGTDAGPTGPNALYTLAGNRITGNSGDGGPPASAQLQYLTGVATDEVTSDFYIADTFNNRIRVVKSTTGIVSTVAGTGIAGFGGDGGHATLAQLCAPNSVAMDSTARLIYISDSLNYRIRMVNMSTGIITTVAGTGTFGYNGDGGLAMYASVSSIEQCAVEFSTGNLFMADSGDDRVRMITLSTGIITTVAGNGKTKYSGDGGLATSASLGNPTGIALDSSGNLYIADTDHFVIRMVLKSTGIITTIAGLAPSQGATSHYQSGGYGGDGGLAMATLLNYPTALAMDSNQGLLYIADTSNNVIRVVSMVSGIITTAAGSSMAGHSEDSGRAALVTLMGVAVDITTGTLYIPDVSNVVREVIQNVGTMSPSTPPANTSQTSQAPSPSSMTQTPSPSSMTQAPSPGRRSRSPSPPSKSQTPSPSSMSQAPSPSSMTQTPSRRRRSRSPSVSSMTQTPSPSSMTQAPSQRRKSRYPSPSPSRVPIAYFSPSLPPDVYFYSPSAPPDVYFYSPSAPPDVYFYSPSAPPDVYFYSPAAPPDVYYYSPSSSMNPSGPGNTILHELTALNTLCFI